MVAVSVVFVAVTSFDWLVITVKDRRIAAAMMNKRDFVFMAVRLKFLIYYLGLKRIETA